MMTLQDRVLTFEMGPPLSCNYTREDGDRVYRVEQRFAQRLRYVSDRGPGFFLWDGVSSCSTVVVEWYWSPEEGYSCPQISYGISLEAHALAFRILNALRELVVDAPGKHTYPNMLADKLGAYTVALDNSSDDMLFRMIRAPGDTDIMELARTAE